MRFHYYVIGGGGVTAAAAAAYDNDYIAICSGIIVSLPSVTQYPGAIPLNNSTIMNATSRPQPHHFPAFC